MIYLDHNATTPVLPEVREVMSDAMIRFWGNPSSTHTIGKAAADALQTARDRLACLLRVAPDEVIFTSGGTEADNWAILGMCDGRPGSTLIISAIEHPAVENAAAFLEKKGIKCRRIPVDSQGIINTETLAEAVSASAHISLISIMTANNETGTLQPVKTAGMLAAAQGIPLHTDAVQAFGKIPLDLHEGAVSLCSISSHKIYGPKGCGALVVRKGAPLHSRTFGGGQEFGMRTGTQNLPAVLGFVKAAEVSCENMIREKQRLLELTEYLYHGIVSCIGGVVRNGHPEARIPGTLNLSFPGTTSGMIVHALDAQGICVSGGAACHAGSEEPSRILVAMGKRKQEAIAGVRFSLGRGNSKEEADAVIPILKLTVDSLRSVNS